VFELSLCSWKICSRLTFDTQSSDAKKYLLLRIAFINQPKNDDEAVRNVLELFARFKA
jgi:hypothetical protein